MRQYKLRNVHVTTVTPNPSALLVDGDNQTDSSPTPTTKLSSCANHTTSTMAAAISALNAKIRSQPVLSYFCSTRASRCLRSNAAQQLHIRSHTDLFPQ